MWFTSRRRFEQIDARLAGLESRLAGQADACEARLRALEAGLGSGVQEILTRFEQHPDERVRFLLNSVAEELRTALVKGRDDARQAGELRDAVARLRDEAEAAAQHLSSRARGEAARQGRVRAQLNRVYQAPWTGYVSVYFTGGWTDRVRLLVGPADPPQECVCELNSRNDVNSYAGTVVRQGEFWVASSQVGSKSGVECIYTPFI